MTEEIEKALEAEELAQEVNIAKAEKMLAEAMSGKTEAPTEREPVDIEAVAQEVHDQREASYAESAARAAEEKAAKFNRETDEMLELIKRARAERFEREHGRAEDITEAKMRRIDAQVIQIFTGDTRKTIQNVQYQPGVVPVPTMAGKTVKKKRRKPGYLEYGNPATWAIAITLMLALIARMTGVA